MAESETTDSREDLEPESWHKREKKAVEPTVQATGAPCDWQMSKEKVAQRGKYLLESGQWSDCKFIVGQEPRQEILEGHKLFLAMASPVFEAMFFGCMAEKNNPIPIRDVQPEAFKSLLEYIYTDRIDLGSFEVACELCYCAKKYMLPYLVKECTEYLWSDLSPKKVCRAYEFAKLFEEPVFLEKCMHVMCTETSKILEDPSWEEVEISTIATLFDRDYLAINSETDLFDALLRWSKAECGRKSLSQTDPKLLRSVTGNLLEKIRFLTLTPQQFADGPGKSQLLTRDEAFAILMNISANGTNITMPDGFSTIKHSRRSPELKFQEQFSASSAIDTSNDWRWSTGMVLSPPMSQYQTQLFTGFNGDNEESACYAARRESMANLHLRMGADPPRNISERGSREVRKLYCSRHLGQATECFNSSVLDCSVTFKVDKNICIIGVEVPTQVADMSRWVPGNRTTYTEILYAHLLDSDGSRLTYTHFTTTATYGSTVEIDFNRSVYIQKDKIYRLGVVFNKAGRYPMRVCSRSECRADVSFSFVIGSHAESVRDGLIRSIVFDH